MAASRAPASGRRAAAVPPAAWWRALLALAALNLAAVLRATSVHSPAADPYWDDAPRHGMAPSAATGVDDDDDDAPGHRKEMPAPSRARDPPAAVCLSGRGTTVACGPGRRELGPDAASSLPPPPGGDEDGATFPSKSRRRRRSGPAAARSPPNPPVPGPSDDGAECVTAAEYQERGPPSTCNDVHGLAFVGSGLHDVTYLTSGGFRSVFVVDFLGGEEGEETAIVKTHRQGKDMSEKYLRKSQLDVLILGEAGGTADEGSPGVDGDRGGDRGGGNVLTVWQYCAFTSVSPYATSGTLADYVGEHGDDLTPDEMYDLSLQAARGLARSHLHRPDGVATFAHADVKPPQFLLFDRGEGKTPEVCLNDFNRGRLLGYDPERRRACPFKLCGVKHNGSTYRSPEEYMSCADQDDRIDVYALGGIIYFIATGGMRPWHYTSFKYATSRILDGETSAYPGDEGYGGDGDDDDDDYDRHGRGGRREGKGRGGGGRRPVPPDARLGHPAVRTLREVVARCWAYRPEERPSSLEVVRKLVDVFDWADFLIAWCVQWTNLSTGRDLFLFHSSARLNCWRRKPSACVLIPEQTDAVLSSSLIDEKSVPGVSSSPALDVSLPPSELLPPAASSIVSNELSSSVSASINTMRDQRTSFPTAKVATETLSESLGSVFFPVMRVPIPLLLLIGQALCRRPSLRLAPKRDL